MATPISESVASREAALGGRLVFLETGVAPAAVRIYEGTRPATADTVPADAMLVELPLADPCGTVADGLLTLSPGDPAMVTKSGAATWARVVNGDGATAFDMDVGDGNSDAQCKLSTTTLFAGGLMSLVSAALG